MFSKKIKNLRKNKKMSQLALAEICNVAQQTVYKWEHGIAYPNIDTLKKLSQFFDVSIDYLLDNEVSNTQKVLILSEEQSKFLQLLDSLNQSGQQTIFTMLDSLKLTHGKRERSSELMNIATPYPNSVIGLVGGRA